MTDTGPSGASWLNRYLSPGRDNVLLIYILYLAGFTPLAPIAVIAGVTMAYLNREGTDPVTRAHYEYQIRQFWMALLFIFISVLLFVVFIGIFGLIATAVWWIVRVVKGITVLARGEAPANPTGWGW